MTSDQENRENKICLGVDPLLSPLAMLVTQDLVLSNYFNERILLGKENLPKAGAVLLAPTHRARWDALMLTMAAGRRETGRDCRFMVTVSEMKGIQGWFLNRLGCFPINQAKPSLTALRYAIDLMIKGEQLVVFPEGHINRTKKPIELQEGLVRLAIMAKRKGVHIKIIPVGLAYTDEVPKPFTKAAICFGKQIPLTGTTRKETSEFNFELSRRMHAAEQAALKAVGRDKKEH